MLITSNQRIFSVSKRLGVRTLMRVAKTRGSERSTVPFSTAAERKSGPSSNSKQAWTQGYRSQLGMYVREDSWLVEPAGDLNRLGVKISKVLIEYPVRLVVTGTSSNMMALKSIARANASFKQQRLNTMAGFYPSVLQGTQKLVQNSGFSDVEAPMFLNVSSMEGQPPVLDTHQEILKLRVSRDTSFGKLAFAIGKCLDEQGRASVNLVGDSQAETAIKAILSARTGMLANGYDLSVFPEIQLICDEDGMNPYEVLVLNILRIDTRMKPSSRSELDYHDESKTVSEVRNPKRMETERQSSPEPKKKNAQEDQMISVPIKEWNALKLRVEMLTTQNSELVQLIANKLNKDT